MHYFHAGNEKDRPFRRAPPAFVREAVGGTYFAGLPVSNQRVGLRVKLFSPVGKTGVP